MNLLDTDIIVEMLQKRKYEHGAISIITLIEVLRGLDAEKIDKVKELIEESFDILTIDNETIKTYCHIYQKLREKGEPLPDADLLIGATAISNNLTLKTGDKHFERLKDFRIKLAQQLKE